ncbi:DUF1737 domain-containing protein [Micromonospora sp. CA-240977]|uniref:DUF1737 domain-containing protein n=1 Tax=Micromonospora sp. CA-240977 TaxID=3239957 RepID=UPI003D92BF49
MSMWSSISGISASGSLILSHRNLATDGLCLLGSDPNGIHSWEIPRNSISDQANAPRLVAPPPTSVDVGRTAGPPTARRVGVSALLDQGYQPYGSPALTSNGQRVIAAQALVLPHSVGAEASRGSVR